jgi:hypothetical protein
MREHHRAKKRRKPNHGGKAEGIGGGFSLKVARAAVSVNIRRMKAL